MIKVERVECPVVGSIASVPIEGRYVLVAECGLACIWGNSRDRGNPVIGGQIIDVDLLDSSRASDELSLRGEQVNALGSQHFVTLMSSNSLEELRSLGVRAFNPGVEQTVVTSGTGFQEVGDYFRLLVPGFLVVDVKASASGGRIFVRGCDQTPATSKLYLSQDPGSFAGGVVALNSGVYRMVSEILYPSGLYRMEVAPATSGDIFTFQYSTVAL